MHCVHTKECISCAHYNQDFPVAPDSCTYCGLTNSLVAGGESRGDSSAAESQQEQCAGSSHEANADPLTTDDAAASKEHYADDFIHLRALGLMLQQYGFSLATPYEPDQQVRSV